MAVVERARADSGGGRGGGIIGGMEGIGGIIGGILVRAKQMRQRPSKNCDYHVVMIIMMTIMMMIMGNSKADDALTSKEWVRVLL